MTMPISERQEEIEAFHSKYFKKPSPPPPKPKPTGSYSGSLSDDEFLQKSFEWKDGDKLRRLLAGDISDYGGDNSKADFACISMLLFRFGGDREKADSVFRQSLLFRDKWDKKHHSDGRTYGQGTIDAALSGKTEFYKPGSNRDRPKREKPKSADDNQQKPEDSKPSEGKNAEDNKQESKPVFRLLRVGDIELKSPEYIVRALVEIDQLFGVFGDPGSGKSLAGIDLACCVATGTDFHGKKVKQGAVVYIAGEGKNGLKRRFTAWGIRHGIDIDAAPIFGSLAPTGLCDEKEADAVVEAIRALPKPPVLIIVDTLQRNFGPGDENSTQDMTRFVAALDRLRGLNGAAVGTVHHTGQADKTRARGSIVLRASLDSEFRISKDMDDIVRLECTKMKDGPTPEPMAFKIRTVELGMRDADGEEVTSAVLDSVSFEPPPQQGKEGRGKNQTRAMALLNDRLKMQRDTLRGSGYDPDNARVSVKDWQNDCLDADISKQAFSTLKITLEKSGRIKNEHGYVYPI